MVEGWLKDIKQKRKGGKLSFYFCLKNKDGKLEEIEDPEPYEFTFWVDTFLDLEILLKDQKFKHLTPGDIDVKIEDHEGNLIKKYHNGERKDLTQVTVKKPFYKSELINYLVRLKKSRGDIKGLIGANRSLNEDYRIQRGFAHNDYVIVQGSKLEKVSREAPEPKSAAYDIEVYNFNKKRGKPYFPRPDDPKNPASAPIICWSFAVSDGKEFVLTHTHSSEQSFVQSFTDEKEMIQHSIELFEQEWPDFIYTWNGNNYDWPYWKIRAEENKISFTFRGYEVKKKRGGLSYIYKIPGIAEIDYMQILSKISERTPGKGLKDVGPALLLKNPVEIEGKNVYEYWDSDELRPELFEYSLKDVTDLIQIIKRQETSKAIDKASNFLGIFPEELRKTGDELCNFFVKRMHKDAIALDDTAFRSRNYIKERNKFYLECVPDIHAAGMLNLDLLHPYVLYELLKEEAAQAKKFRIDFGKYEILYSSIESLLAKCAWAKEEFDKTSKPEYKTLNKLLRSIAKEFPSLILSERYDWYSKSLGKKYVAALENKIKELTDDDLLYADWDNAFVFSSSLDKILNNSKSEFGCVLDVEHQESPIVDVQIMNNETYVYLNRHNNMFYHKGITVKKKKEGQLINALVEGFYRALFKGGKEAVKTYFVDAGISLSKCELSKEELLKIGSIAKPETHYVVDSEKVIASRLYDTKPFEQYEYGVSNGKIVKAEDYVPVPSDAIKQFIKRIERSIGALGLESKEIEVAMKKGKSLGEAQSKLEYF